MERLIHKEKDGDLTCHARDFAKIFPTLYDYEETGKTPFQVREQTIMLESFKEKLRHHDVDRFMDLLEADREGRVMVLPAKPEPKVEMNIYDKVETIEGCTVQVLTNTVTGEASVGWWKGSAEDMPGKELDHV